MRLCDAIVAGLGIVLLSPLFLLISLSIKLTTKGPVFYRPQRVGKDGKPFRLFKFRTMVAGADLLGPKITRAGDPRITPIGRFLRDTKLDELPQLFNVVRGEMSLVGPRPEDPHYVDLYDPDQRRILSIRPGITSPASLAFRHEERMLSEDDWEKVYRARILPAKLEIDSAYFARHTLFSDWLLILRTLLVCLHSRR